MIKVGRKYRFVNTEESYNNPSVYPMVGTVGTCLAVIKHGSGEIITGVKMAWPEGSTNGCDVWTVSPTDLAPAYASVVYCDDCLHAGSPFCPVCSDDRTGDNPVTFCSRGKINPLSHG